MLGWRMAHLGAQQRRNALGREDTWPPFLTGMNKHTSSHKPEATRPGLASQMWRSVKSFKVA